jgi:hypothetical protein
LRRHKALLNSPLQGWLGAAETGWSLASKQKNQHRKQRRDLTRNDAIYPDERRDKSRRCNATTNSDYYTNNDVINRAAAAPPPIQITTPKTTR